jgi:hypothetical protein
LRACAGQQGSQFVAAFRSGLQRRPMDVFFDGAYRQRQSLGNSRLDNLSPISITISRDRSVSGKGSRAW